MGIVTWISHRAEIQEAAQAAKDRALEIMGGKAETYAKQLAPVDTGRLRASISHAQLDENTEEIGSNVSYAKYQEFGTSRMAAHPFLRPAAENHAEEYRQIWLNELRKG